jgi:hypothetical protein
MAALCFDASFETLQPLCCRCLHKGSPQALRAVVSLSARHVLQNSPKFIVQGFEVCTPRKSILGADEGKKVPPQPLLRCLGLLGTN